MQKIYIDRTTIFRHLIAWLLLGVILQIAFPLYFPFYILLIRGTAEILVLMTCYYLTIFFISPFYEVSKVRFLCYLISNLFIYFILYYLVEFSVAVVFDDAEDIKPNAMWVSHTLIYGIITMFLAFSFYKNKLSIQLLENESEAENVYLLQEILFIKNQFNSHISFNFLNFCYKFVLNVDINGTKAIDTYSEMLRYTISISPLQVVPLKNEIEYIEQFIAIQGYINNNIHVHFSKFGDFNKGYVLPRIFISFIENTFKYGISNDSNKPIIINLYHDSKILKLNTFNFKKMNLTKLSSTKVGIKNAHDQLKLFYPNKFKFDIVDKEDSYYCEIEINLD